MPVDEAFVELTFPSEKTVYRPNKSREQTSHKLQFQQNTVALLRSERAFMIAGSKSKGNHSTLAQVQKAGDQMLAAVRKYTPAHMSALSGPRTYHGCLKRTDVAQAEAAVAKKRTERAKQGAWKAPTEAALRRRQLAFSTVPTKHVKELAVIAAVADDERRGAVVSEVKFKGKSELPRSFLAPSNPRSNGGFSRRRCHSAPALRSLSLTRGRNRCIRETLFAVSLFALPRVVTKAEEKRLSAWVLQQASCCG
jgi:hypothetical protein